MSKGWQGDGWEIREGRWQDSPPAEVDVIISDPPYDERTHKGARRTKGLTVGPDGKREINTRRVIGYPPIDPAVVGPRLVAIAKRWVLLFCSIEQLGRYQDACGESYYRGGWFWKTAPQPQLNGQGPGTPGDGIAILHRRPGKRRWNGGGHVARYIGNPSAIRGRCHDQEKPLPTMLELVGLYSEPGELVYDPYCGSATTGVACLRLGRKFIGHEMQPHYAKIAAERLAAEERGLTLADVRGGQTSIYDVEGVQ